MSLPSLNEMVKPLAIRPISTLVPVARYIGDPMCSWCWGISPALKEVSTYCQIRGLDFSVHVGGLRHEWENIHRVTGQPFGFSVLDEAEFNYDTEPACRAVVAISRLQASSQVLLAFFSGINGKVFEVNDALSFIDRARL